MEFLKLVEVVLEGYSLDWDGIHGIGHWTRVFENGLKLAEKACADVDIVTLFAVFHDSRRLNEGHDPDHGARGAQLAAKYRGILFDLDDRAFSLLEYACVWHTAGLTNADISVQCCWDADRLDLGRCWIEPDPILLCTDFAKDKSMLRWAGKRSRMEFVPELIQPLWDKCQQSNR